MGIRNRFVHATLGGLVLLGSATSALASGELVPSNQSVGGYSLADAAQATAVFNTGTNYQNPNTPALPSLPFTVVVADATVSPNAYIYLPIFFSDTSAPADPDFPADISNQQTDATYLLGAAGVSRFLVQVDGQTSYLGGSYITGVNTPTLLDGTPGGNEYISAAAFVSPLSPGEHMVSVGGTIDGTDQVFITYAVDAIPEPASALGFVCAAGVLLRRPRRG